MKLKLSVVLLMIAGLVYILLSSQDTIQKRGKKAISQNESPSQPADQGTTSRNPTLFSRERSEPSDPKPRPTTQETNAQAKVTNAQHKAIKEVLGMENKPNSDTATNLDILEQGEEEIEEMLFSTDREGIKGAIEEMNEQIRECYHGWLQTNPELKGRIVLAFTISPPQKSDDEGSVIEDAKLLVDNLKHPMMSGCLLNSVQGLKFETVKDKITIHYPYRFSSGTSAQ